MEDVQTTGGLFTANDRRLVISNICGVFSCSEEDIEELVPLQAGETNIVLSFKLNGGKYVYRHPGLGSELLVNRSRESIIQKIAEDAGVDTTLVAMDAEAGWKIARFVEHYRFDYHNLNHMVRAMMLLRRLHAAPCHVRWSFDAIKEAERIKARIKPEYYGRFPDFENIRSRIYQLAELAGLDGIPKCNIHGDAHDANILINREEIYLIDWEYGGYGDPGFDIGSYVMGGRHTLSEIDKILFTYFRRNPTAVQKRHIYANIAIAGWFFMHWAMFQLNKGQSIGCVKEQFYHYAKNMSLISLPLYGVQVDQEQYDAAMAALTDCHLEDLSYMDEEIGAKEARV